MNHIDMLSKKDFGKLDNEYVRNGMTVKLYSPNMSESQRITADIRIKERVLNIVSESDYENVAS